MATLTSTKIKNTYDALLKATDNDAIGSVAKQITDGLGNGTPLYISTTQIGIGVTPEATYDLHVYSNAKVGGNLTVTGDLTVEGTTTTIDTQTLTVEDPLIEVASNNTSTDAVDIGWYGKYAPSGTTLYAGLFRDTGDSKFKLFRNLQEQPTTTVNTSGTGYTKADLIIGGLEATTGDFTDTVTVDGDIEVENSSGFGRIEIGGSSGGYIDLKSPFSDDFDLRLYTAGTNAQINAINGELDITAYTNINLQNQGTDVLVMSSTGVAVTGDLTVDTDTLFVDSTNNRVGILTTSPSDALNVDDDVAGSVRITIDNANAAGFSTLRFEENDTERAALYYSNAADTFNLQNNTNSGNLRLQTTNSIGTTTNGIIINGSSEAVELNYAGSKKLETTSGGISVTGTGSFTGQVTIPATPVADTDAASKGYVDGLVEGQDTLAEILANGNLTGGTDIIVNSGDNITLAGGGSTSTVIEHNVYDTRIINDSSLGAIILRGDAIVLQNTTGTEGLARFDENAGVQLNYDNSKKFETTSTGVRVTGEVYIDGTGNWSLKSDVISGNLVLKDETNNADRVDFHPDGQVEILYAGVATTPSLIFNNDINTGIFHPSNDNLAFATAGSERMRIDSSGNIDIGTNGSGARNSRLLLQNPGAQGAPQLMLIDGHYPTIQGEIRFDTGNLIYEYWNGSSRSERMRIDNSGRVGIGTESLNTYDKLQVIGNAYIGGNATRGVRIADGGTYASMVGINQAVTAYTGLELRASGTNGQLFLDTNGNVGIGQTSTPTKTLSVNGEIFQKIRLNLQRGSSGATTLIQFLNEVGTDRAHIDFGGTNEELSFFAGAGSSEHMRIDSSGAVGIGVIPESNRFASHDVLQVGARATLLSNDTVSLTGQTALLDNLYYDSSGNFQHRGNAAGATVQMYEGNIIFQNSNQTSGTPTVTERMRITSGGYVKASNSGSYISTTNTNHEFTSNANGTAFTINNASGNPYALQLNYTAVAPNNTSNRFLECIDTSSTKLIIYSNGTVANATNTYTSLSDRKLKENIEDATPKLDDLMQVQIKNFNLIGDDTKQIGVIAQELEEIFPALVYETPDTERQEVNKTDEEGNIIYKTEEVLISQAVEGQEAIEWEDKPTIDNTKVEIQTWLDDNSIEWQSADTKQELLDRIPEYQQEAIEAQDAVYETRETDIPETINKEVDLGTTTKAVKYSVFVPMLIKAMQEQQEIINDLKARIEALEN